MTTSDPRGPQSKGAPTSVRVLRSFAWQGGAVALGQVVSWISTLIVIRMLSPNDYGLMAMANLFVGLLLLVSDLGVGSAAVQSRNLDRDAVRVLFGLVIATNLAGAALTWVASPWIAAFFAEPRLVPMLRVMSLGFGLVALYVLPQALLMRDLHFDRKARADVFAATLAALVTLSLAASGLGVWALVGGMLSTHCLRALAFQVLRPCLPLPSFAFRSSRDSVQFGALVTLSRILWWSYGNLDVAIAGRVLGKTLLGTYSVALSLASIPLDKVMPIVTQVSFAAFSRIQDDHERVERNVLRALQAVSLVALPGFVGMAAVAPEAIPLILGAKWEATVIPFQLLCTILPLKALAAVLSPALFGIGRPWVNVVNMAITLTVMAIAFAVGVRNGLLGLCLAWVIAYPAVFCITSARSLRALDLAPARVWAAVRFFFGATLAMLLALEALRLALAPITQTAVLLGTLIACGAAVYGLAVWIFQRPLLRSFWSLAREDV